MKNLNKILTHNPACYIMGASYYDKETGKYCYCIKAGATRDLVVRFSQYHSHNPFIFCLGYWPYSTSKGAFDKEEQLLSALNKNFKKIKNTDEWFKIDTSWKDPSNYHLKPLVKLLKKDTSFKNFVPTVEEGV